jgi:hypothetical protein
MQIPMDNDKALMGYLKQVFSDMKAKRSNYEQIWVDIDRFVFGFTGSYDSNPTKGQKRFENIYTTTTLKAHRTATSALAGL